MRVALAAHSALPLDAPPPCAAPVRRPRAQVVSSYKREGLPPPASVDIASNQKTKIQKLVEEYIRLTRRDGAA